MDGMNVEQVLELFYEKINSVLFQGRLPVITFAIRGDGRNKDGWGYEIHNGNYCIYLFEFCLYESMQEIYKNLLHQMIHIYNMENGNKDTSRGKQYHNNIYQKSAVLHGLKIVPDATYGCITVGIEEDILRKIIYKDARKILMNAIKQDIICSENQLYVCPICSRTAKASADVKLICGYCRVEMVKKKSLYGTRKKKMFHIIEK